MFFKKHGTTAGTELREICESGRGKHMFYTGSKWSVRVFVSRPFTVWSEEGSSKEKNGSSSTFPHAIIFISVVDK